MFSPSGFGKDFLGIIKKLASPSANFQKILMVKEILITDFHFLPLGGYVKIAGMVDESFDTEFAR